MGNVRRTKLRRGWSCWRRRSHDRNSMPGQVSQELFMICYTFWVQEIALDLQQCKTLHVVHCVFSDVIQLHWNIWRVVFTIAYAGPLPGEFAIIYKWVSQQQDEIDAYIDELVEQCVEQNGIKDNVDLAWKWAVCLLYLQKKCPAEKSLKMVGWGIYVKKTHGIDDGSIIIRIFVPGFKS